MTFEEFFDKTWPDHSATLKMYEEGSPAVDALDCLLPNRTKHAAEKVWKARDAELSAAQARIAELREALGVLAQCAIDAIETDYDIDEIIKRFNTSINGALKETDDLAALEAVKARVKREALIEAAGVCLRFSSRGMSPAECAACITSMAGEVKP